MAPTERNLHRPLQAGTVRNPVEAAYARSDLLERRRRVMGDWAGLAGRGRGRRLPGL